MNHISLTLLSIKLCNLIIKLYNKFLNHKMNNRNNNNDSNFNIDSPNRSSNQDKFSSTLNDPYDRSRGFSTQQSPYANTQI